MIRPAVDIVVPFAGSPAALPGLVERLERLSLGSRDTVVVVDNRPARDVTPFPPAARVRSVAAPELRSSYYARNRGAAAGDAPWLVFLDSDVDPVHDLVDRLFDPPPDPRTGALAGGIRDTDDGPVAAQVAAHASLGDRVTLDRPWGYAQTANCAVRREAFEAAGGFADDIRSGGDADLCFRLRDAGWLVEHRPDALVVHESRTTLRALIRQKARHGAGAAWVEQRWPGSMPPRPVLPLLGWLAKDAAKAPTLLLRADPAGARSTLVAPIATLAFELGRRLSNHAR